MLVCACVCACRQDSFECVKHTQWHYAQCRPKAYASCTKDPGHWACAGSWEHCARPHGECSDSKCCTTCAAHKAPPPSHVGLTFYPLPSPAYLRPPPPLEWKERVRRLRSGWGRCREGGPTKQTGHDSPRFGLSGERRPSQANCARAPAHGLVAGNCSDWKYSSPVATRHHSASDPSRTGFGLCRSKFGCFRRAENDTAQCLPRVDNCQSDSLNGSWVCPGETPIGASAPGGAGGIGRAGGWVVSGPRERGGNRWIRKVSIFSAFSPHVPFPPLSTQAIGSTAPTSTPRAPTPSAAPTPASAASSLWRRSRASAGPSTLKHATPATASSAATATRSGSALLPGRIARTNSSR
eukprot:4633877-Pleurochrysis_carterae.AAC.1